MKLSPVVFACALACTLIACSGSSGDTDGAVQAVEERSFPTLEPFRASRMANFVFSEGMPGSSDGEGEELEEFLRTGEVFRVEAADGEASQSDPHALLELSSWERSWAAMVPVAISKLEPLFEKTRRDESWTGEEFDVASTVLALLKLAPSSWAPLGDVQIQRDASAANAEELDTMLHWFEGRASEPACMAAMIATMDDGPWIAEDWRANGRSTVMESQRITGDLEVRILLIEEDRPWCLQGVRGGEVLWTKHLSKIPAGSLTFAEKPPTPLGTYGFKIHLSFGEYSHVYLSSEGEFLFYFTSW